MVNMHGWLDSMVRHVWYAVRALAKMPAFTGTVVLTLALGIGANSAVFSAIDAVLLRPLPFPHSDQLVKLGQSGPKCSRLDQFRRYHVALASNRLANLPFSLASHHNTPLCTLLHVCS